MNLPFECVIEALPFHWFILSFFKISKLMEIERAKLMMCAFCVVLLLIFVVYTYIDSFFILERFYILLKILLLSYIFSRAGIPYHGFFSLYFTGFGIIYLKAIFSRKKC